MKFLLLLLLPSCLAFRDLEPALPEPRTRNTPVEGWVNVRLNHFDASNNDTFPMRYYYNSEFSNASNSNVVIFVGGEWGISPNWVTGGLPYELAQELSAGLFYTEHRYYGQTRPSEGTSVAELRYLTVDQALADLLQFIQIITSDQFENGRYKGGKVSLIGCSYAGSMATWMRLAYPHTIAAAFSDSGPLHAQEDFPEYLETISEALRSQGGDSCVSSVEEGMRWVTAALESDAGAQQVSTLFNTCTPINRTNELDVATFFWFGVTETFAYLVQYATPGDIAEACNALTDTSIANAGERLAAWIRSHTSGLPCLETRYQEVVTAHRDTSYDAPDSVMRLWTYQTCVEYGWYQTTTGTEHPFLDVVPLEYFHQMCKDFFDESFDEEFLRSGIRRTNVLFAGLTHLPDGTVTVVGGADPWSPMGPNITHQTYLAPVYVVPDESHCRAVRSTDPSNPNTPLERAKRSVLSHMKSFVETNLPAETTAGAITQHSNMLLLLTAVLLIRI